MKRVIFFGCLIASLLILISSCIIEKKEISPVECLMLTSPTGVQATKGEYDDKIVLLWDKVSYAESYRIYRSTSIDSGFVKVKSTEKTYFEDNNVNPSIIYYYKVKAFSSEFGLTPFSGISYGYVSGGFTPPQNLTASKAVYGDKIELSWDPVDDADYYIILRSRSPESGYITLDTTEANSYSDYVPTTGSYFYRIRVYSNQFGHGIISEYVFGCRHESLMLLDSWDQGGAGDGTLVGTDIKVDGSGNIYLLERSENRVQKFDSDGNYIIHWGTGPAAGDGEFNDPRSIAVDNFGYVYISDYYNSRIQKFDSDGTFISKFGSDGTGPNQFHYPQGIDVDDNGDIYVSDGNSFQIFDSGFNNIEYFDKNHSLTCEDTGYLGNSDFICVDIQGNIILSDQECLYARILDQDLNETAKFGGGNSSSRPGDCDFNGSPLGVTVNDDGCIYITDMNSSKIHKADRFGNCLQVFDLSTYLSQPHGIYLFQNQYLFITGFEEGALKTKIVKFLIN